MAREPVSVVVPCRDRPDRLAECLAALQAELADGDEVVVADSASRDGRVAQVAADAGARVVRCAQPGASRARNAGWQAARNALVAFTDDDMLVAPGWLDSLAAVLAGAGTGFAVGRTESVGGAADGHGGTVTVAEPPAVMMRERRGSLGASNNLALRRSALEQAGGFDERLGPGTWFEAGEDLELLDRVLRAGYVGRYAPDALARHVQWRSPGERLHLQFAYGKGMGARVAAALRRAPREGVHLLGEVLRVSGLITALLRLSPARRRRASASTGPATGASGVPDSSGWLGPLAWRAGAVVGLLAGLARLGPR